MPNEHAIPFTEWISLSSIDISEADGQPVVVGAPIPATCFECDRTATSNNHVNNYPLVGEPGGWGMPMNRDLCTRCLRREFIRCHECERYVRTINATGDGYCPDDAALCPMGGTFASPGHRVDALGRSGACEEHSWYCAGCSDYHADSEPQAYEDEDYEPYCSNTVPRRGRNHGVRGYGHTHPQLWFGGPLPRDEAKRRVGYYLGFELEITADAEDARPIYAWEQANGMGGFFDCKQDGSVRGFEIATQPFTPQFFETIVADGRLESFFAMLNDSYPVSLSGEPTGHGLHVHIGKVAFFRDMPGMAAFCYLLGQDNGKHLERIARRSATGYCATTTKPVGQVVVMHQSNTQANRLRSAGLSAERGALNVHNDATVEVRAFRSTRKASELADAIRLVYSAADYVRWLRAGKQTPTRRDPEGGRGSRTHGLDPKALAWTEYTRWAAEHCPLAFPTLANLQPAKVRTLIPICEGEASMVPDDLVTSVAPRPRRWVHRDIPCRSMCRVDRDFAHTDHWHFANADGLALI